MADKQHVISAIGYQWSVVLIRPIIGLADNRSTTNLMCHPVMSTEPILNFTGDLRGWREWLPSNGSPGKIEMNLNRVPIGYYDTVVPTDFHITQKDSSAVEDG